MNHNKKLSDQYDKMMQAAQDAALAAAEAMDRGDVKEWTALHDRAANLRKRAAKCLSSSNRRKPDARTK